MNAATALPLIAATAVGLAFQNVVLGVILGIGWWVQAVTLATRHELMAVSSPDLQAATGTPKDVAP